MPAMMIPRERLIDTARRVYRSYGFSPIDTPALEYLEILTGKGSEETDKQLYRFQDHGGRWVGLRFDLTVPLARFAAQHMAELGTPLKRYHIATVWRGENTQRGRYREFMQCDFDTIGTRSVAADIETALVIHDLFRALGFSDFTIHVNNRLVLTGLLGAAGPGRAVHGRALRRSTSSAKIGPDAVADEMVSAAGATPEQARQVLRLWRNRRRQRRNAAAGSNALVSGSEAGQAGVAKLKELLDGAAAAGVPGRAPPARSFDRPRSGLLHRHDLRDVVRRAARHRQRLLGGRYDNLAGLYTAQELPGIGASLGLDRLLAAMEELGMIEKISTPAPVFIPYFDEDRLHDYLRLAAALRAAGIGVEFFPDPKKLGQQLKYADRRGFRVALIAGGDEFQSGVCQVKDLQTGTKQDVPLEPDGASIIAAVKGILGL